MTRPQHAAVHAARRWQVRAALAWAVCGIAAAAPPASTYRDGDRLPALPAAQARTAYRTVNWDDLLPGGWDPMQGIDLRDASRWGDGDPRAVRALAALKRAWDHAPAAASLDHARIRLPGFVVPLDGEPGALREFLLVPYFGACIHTPPPPSNQVIHVRLATPAKNVRMMDAVWLSGEMHVDFSETGLGSASYRMDGHLVLPYRER